MEQFNTGLPVSQEEISNAAGAFEARKESVLLEKVRQKFGFYGGISLIFGVVFTLCFYKAWIGINVFTFSALMVVLLCVIMNKLSVEIKSTTKLYYLGVMLLGVSTTLTSSEILQFLNIVGILFLLDLSLLHQFHEDGKWEFVKHIGRMFGLIIYSIASIATPIIDGINFMKHTKVLKNDRIRNIVLGALLSLPVLLFVTALLSGADMIFGNITKNIFHSIFSADIFYIIIMLIFGFFACYCILCGALYKAGMEEKSRVVKGDPTIAITFMVLLCLVYAFFCGIQVVYLFANGLFAIPDQFTFAEYARKGFFELLAVTIINIIIMILCNTLFRESKILKLLITCMTACTYIMIASATYRMLLYIGAYHLTFLRLFVLLTLLIDAFVLAGIIIYQYHKEFPLFRYCVFVISICYIAFSFSKPDYYIASYLADHNEVLTQGDLSFLTQELSLDAAPVVLPLMKDTKRWSLTKLEEDEMLLYGDSADTASEYYQRITNAKSNMGIRDFNYSYYMAIDYAKRYPISHE